jgi:hypothetical protein
MRSPVRSVTLPFFSDIDRSISDSTSWRTRADRPDTSSIGEGRGSSCQARVLTLSGGHLEWGIEGGKHAKEGRLAAVCS